MGAAPSQYKVTEKTQEKSHRKRKTKPWKITRIAFLFIVGYLVFSFSHGFYQAYHLKSEITNLESKLSELKARNNQLQEELNYMQSSEAVEKLAREKLGLIKPGEIVIMHAKQAN